MDYSKIITIESGKRSGKPCIRGMRMTITDVLEYLAGGMTEEEIIEDLLRKHSVAIHTFGLDDAKSHLMLP